MKALRTRWRRRHLIYKIFGAVPGGPVLFNKIRTRRRFEFRKRAYIVREIPALLRDAGKNIDGKVVAEIGSGWNPVLPILFYGMGAKQILMTDILPYMRQRGVEEALVQMMKESKMIATESGVAEAELLARWKHLVPGRHPWQTVWRDLGITYHAPLDFSATDWEEKSLDVIVSNSCLGYIPQPALKAIFIESFRLLRSSGYIAHQVSVYDDYSGVDSSISPLNFLYFSRERWDEIGNCRLHYQNRLRPSEYENLALKAGFNLAFSRKLRRRIQPEMLDRERLAEEFRGFSDEDLLCAHMQFVAERPS